MVAEPDGAALVEDLETLLVLLVDKLLDTEAVVLPLPLAVVGSEFVVVPPAIVVLTVVATGVEEMSVVVSDGTVKLVTGSELPRDR